LTAWSSLAINSPVSATERHAVSLSGVFLEYQAKNGLVSALHDIDLQVPEGRFVAIVGPSGCGKSTLLQLMSGLMKPTKGQVLHFGKPLTGIAVGTGFAFQGDGLLAWKTVAENIALPLRLQGATRDDIRARVADWIKRCGLTRFASAYPSQLSGGMRKRVALAQALVAQPKLVLMDEPLSALDVQTRTIIGNELLTLWSRTESTMVLVTHDLEEAIGMADSVVVLTHRPARVKAVYDVHLPRPRDLHDIRLTDEFQRLYAAIWSDLREEVLRSHVEMD
jgi:NitT/TauT family transport system ATP-binding protein